jgi:adenylate cyclase
MTAPVSGSPQWKPLAEALVGPPDLTPGEVARAAGFARDETRRLWQALGFPPAADEDRIFTHGDVEILRTVRALIDQEDTDVATVVQLARVTGQALARIADAQVTAAADRLERLRAAAAPPDDAAALAGRLAAIAPRLEHLLGHVWRRHLLAALLRTAATPAAADRAQVVGFADLVGFTSMSEALETHALAAMVDRFEAIAYAQIPARGGRVVKTIGDAVMFAADDAAAAAEIALGLVEEHARHPDLPDARAGLARGPVLAWEGDLFGPTVNLASRLVHLARAGTVLVADDLGMLLCDLPGLALHHLRPVRLQGIGRVRSWVLRRAR